MQLKISVYIYWSVYQNARKIVASDFQWKTAGIETASVGVSSVSKQSLLLMVDSLFFNAPVFSCEQCWRKSCYFENCILTGHTGIQYSLPFVS